MTATRITPSDLALWRSWIGRTEIRTQWLDPESLRRFAAAAGCDLDVEHIAPPLGHWAYFLEAAPDAAIGVDGHPGRGGLLPPVTLPRRMFAAARIDILAPLDLSREASLRVTVADIRHRTGGSGDLVFVDLDHSIRQGAREHVRERQTLVFRDAGGPVGEIVAVAVPPGPNDHIWTPGPVDLFRFSAATFNAHRIHYDQPYARAAEGYPDLVVHGPFAAVRLCAYAEAALGAPASTVFFRATAPLFVSQPVRLTSGPAPGEFRAVRCDGVTAMTASIEIRA
jgi:3-methylfumaryl-CoA hydratase